MIDERLSGELAAELDRNDQSERQTSVPRVVDPRSVRLRFHHLREVATSPAHALHSIVEDDDKDSLCIRLGAGTHAICFGKPVAVFDQPAANGKGGKAPRNGKVWEEFQARHTGATILSSAEFAAADRMASAIRGHEIAAELLFGPDVVHEQTILWEQQGRARRSTPDAHGPSYVVELKTARSAAPDAFARDSWYRYYHAQLADQSAAIEAETGSRPWSAYVVVVESAPPHVVQVLQLTPRALEHGAELCRRWLDRILACEASNEWPGYSRGICDLDLPGFAGTEQRL